MTSLLSAARPWGRCFLFSLKVFLLQVSAPGYRSCLQLLATALGYSSWSCGYKDWSLILYRRTVTGCNLLWLRVAEGSSCLKADFPYVISWWEFYVCLLLSHQGIIRNKQSAFTIRVLMPWRHGCQVLFHSDNLKTTSWWMWGQPIIKLAGLLDRSSLCFLFYLLL